ncbi:MAG: chromate transporter [Oscillospiraceae bacterium]|nr:chromate transporter [Oscillospiraceae bacterium]
MIGELFLTFLKIGLFTFGGAYGSIPLIREAVVSHGWMDDAMVSNLIAVSESTPGPIMVNMATYIGSRQAGVPGAAAATLGVVLPSFVIILLVAAVFYKAAQNRFVQAALRGIKPSLTGVILATGLLMALGAVLGRVTAPAFSAAAAILFAALSAALLLWRLLRKQALPPLLLLSLGALGGVLYYVISGSAPV